MIEKISVIFCAICAFGAIILIACYLSEIFE